MGPAALPGRVSDPILQRVQACTGARTARRGERIQSLWSGYGELYRVDLQGAEVPSVIVKSVRPPSDPTHPRGWSGDRGHQRKLRSYDVELAFYWERSGGCPAACRVPRLLDGARDDAGWLFVLEDLDAAGFPQRRRSDAGAMWQVVDWLAAFHATFLGDGAAGLWPTGTYWHLATRPDELEGMAPGPLKEAAAAIDARLTAAAHPTLVHGDAKLANFCFGTKGVAAVDFQYVGGGCGLKDLAYFLGSVLNDAGLARNADLALDRYFRALGAHLGAEAKEVEAAWRPLWPFAWADFERFLAGWAPGHWKRTGYAARQTDRALRAL